MKKVYRMVLILLMLLPAVSFAQTDDDCRRNVIQTQGEAEVFGQNDSVKISFSVVTEGKSLDAVSAENADNTNKVLVALKKLIIKNMSMETANYYVSPQKDYKARPPVIVGYEVQNTLSVKIEELDPQQLSVYSSRIIGAALENGANRISNIRFYIKDMDALENEALAQATQKAKKRAEVLAKAAGVSIKQILSIHTPSASVSPISPKMMRTTGMAAESDTPAPPMEVGQSSVRMQVSMGFEIEPQL